MYTTAETFFLCCVQTGHALSKNHPAEEPLLLWPMVIFFSLPRFGASIVNLSSEPRSKLSLSLSSRLSPFMTKDTLLTYTTLRASQILDWITISLLQKLQNSFDWRSPLTFFYFQKPSYVSLCYYLIHEAEMTKQKITLCCCQRCRYRSFVFFINYLKKL